MVGGVKHRLAFTVSLAKREMWVLRKCAVRGGDLWWP